MVWRLARERPRVQTSRDLISPEPRSRGLTGVHRGEAQQLGRVQSGLGARKGQYTPASASASYMAMTFTGGTSAWMLWTVLKT